MRQLFRWLRLGVLISVLMPGCGGSGNGIDGDSSLVVRLQEFNGEGLVQSDQVRSNSADVDVVQNFCRQSSAGSGGELMVSQEVFTQTSLNAVFVNNQRLDVLLDRMVVHFDDQRVGFGDLEQGINAVVRGGRCSNVTSRPCSVDAECTVGIVRGFCNFGETAVSSLLLVDLAAKEAVQPSLYGQSIPARITFTGSDIAGKDYQVTAGYTVTFANFCNCGAGDICCETMAQCLGAE